MPSLSYRQLNSGGYLLSHPFGLKTRVCGHLVTKEASEFFDLTMDGWLTVYPGFEWDGASGPAKDTDSIMIPALVHDAFYSMIERGFLPRRVRLAADLEFRWLIEEYADWDFAAAQFRGQCSRSWGWCLHKLRIARAHWCFWGVRIFGGLWLRSHKGKPAKVMKKIAMMIVLLSVTGCAQFWRAAQTADDVARQACAQFFADHQGITVKEAAKAFCDTREAIDVFLAAQEAAGQAVAESQGVSRK